MLDDFYLEPKTQKFYIATMPEYILNADNIWDLGPVVQSWVSANPGLTFYSILVCVFVNVCVSVRFKTLENKTPIVPDKISEEILLNS